MHKFKSLAAIVALACTATGALADGWTLSPDMSQVAFGSVKNSYVGESHSFGAMSGGVAADGTVTLNLDLGSVETLIDIRNERMIEHVFKAAPSATVTAQIDMAALDALGVGEAMVTEAAGTLTLLGTDVGLDVPFFVMRVAEDRVLATTDGLVMVATDELGIDAGIDVLQELASLDSITRVSPVTMRLVFDRDS